MTNLAEVTTFINDCVKKLGAGFHPDTPFEDYYKGDMRIFNDVEAKAWNEKMSEAMAYCWAYEHDIYEIGLVALSNTGWFDSVNKNS